MAKKPVGVRREKTDRVALRRAAMPKLTYPSSLPIVEFRDELVQTIRDHQVVIVAGETGSGKSTQLPKFCLEAGRGIEGLIGHTQPRRVAARTIAERVAEELGVELGTAVGYTVRFTDHVRDSTLIEVMTDGILLAEIQRDPKLRRYDTIIIDEAHERSLNVDFLLGYLKQLLPKRLDLKVIVTSATIDTQRFSEHFNNAPVITVAGRTYPVEMRYRPIGAENFDDPNDDRDQVQAVCDAVMELAQEGPGDVLVFFSGEREIRDTADALRRLELRNTDVLPLYARLSSAEQHRIFQAHTGRRIVLATNVAETSLTVPGVRYVVDTGTARISRYSRRLKVQRLPIEPISQASANQRSGRCGRVAPGVCIRLFSQDDFKTRPLFTEPEILRTNLASVILQMTAIGLGDVDRFPFLEPPDRRSVRDGVLLLEELGAIEPGGEDDPNRRLTKMGRQLAQLPVDPRLGRMVIEADRNNCVREVLVIASAMSIQDPRERPTEKQQAADESHRRFNAEGSDFMALVKLWDYLREQQRELSGSQFRRMCRTEYFNYLRVREWSDLFSQLRQVAGTLDIRVSTEAGHPDRVHQSLLAGLLSHIGMRDGVSREFSGARGSKFSIVPRSALAKKPPKWVMAGELVETNRLWGRMAASMQPEWAESLAPHLVKRSFSEPRWDARRGAAVATERVLLYGLPIVAGRTCGFDKVDPSGARELFIRHALVENDWTTHHKFVEVNRAFLDDVRQMADRVRKGNLVDDDAVFAFYTKRVPDTIVSARHFDRWWKDERRKHPDLLTLTIEVLSNDGQSLSEREYPESWSLGDLTLPVSYLFDASHEQDGVTVHVPFMALNQLDDDVFTWQVPGLRVEVVEGLIRNLPKQFRRLLVPIADNAAAAVARLDTGANGPLRHALAPVLTELAGERIVPSDIDDSSLALHLRVTFSVEDNQGKCVALGKDLGALRAMLGAELRAATVAAFRSTEKSGIREWDFGELPQTLRARRDGIEVLGYPTLLDVVDSVSIRVVTNRQLQMRSMRLGVRRLLLLTVPVSRKALERSLSNDLKLTLSRQATVPVSEIMNDCVLAAADFVISEHGDLPWDGTAFSSLQNTARRKMADIASMALGDVGMILAEAAVVRLRVGDLTAAAAQTSAAEINAHLSRLLQPGFVSTSGTYRLLDIHRYVQAANRRIDKVMTDTVRDRQMMREINSIEQRYGVALAAMDRSAVTADVVEIRWMIEELRVSYFAQSLGTAQSVSAARINRAIDQMASGGTLRGE